MRRTITVPRGQQSARQRCLHVPGNQCPDTLRELRCLVILRRQVASGGRMAAKKLRLGGATDTDSTAATAPEICWQCREHGLNLRNIHIQIQSHAGAD